MKEWARGIVAASAAAVFASVLWFHGVPVQGQAAAYRAPRAIDGKPDLSGIWEAMGTANWDIETHVAKPGPIIALGALGAIPAGLGVVEGGPLPYRPEALAQKKMNAENWLTLDPVVKCYMPGVPRATYMPFPFEIVQSPKQIAIAYEFAFAERVISFTLTDKDKSPVDSYMGWSRGSWDGDTLVADVTGLNDDTWFDSAGNYHSDSMHVIERYTPTSPNTMMYEATIDDPKTFTRPWKMSMPLYRHVEKNAAVLDFNCVPFVEELQYGQFRRKAVSN